MIGIKEYLEYFENNARQWIVGGYDASGYNYPTAMHRVRIVSKFISSLNKSGLKIIDLGCGGGDLSFRLAEDGHTVLGVDQSSKMVEIAEKNLANFPKKIKAQVRFLRGEIDEKMMPGEKFDVVAAMGLIGYLPDDKTFFKIAGNLLKPGGHLLVSSRNRLFNMKSIGFRTEREIKNKYALKLVRELGGLYNRVSAGDAHRFIGNLKKTVSGLPESMAFDRKSTLSPLEKHGLRASILKTEPRQSTPEELKKTALKCGFEHRAYYGVHPHLIDPALNKMLPPQLFNRISDCLEAFEHLPISLAWSSVFIGVFKKSGKKI